MAMSFVITVLDDDHLEIVTEQDLEIAFPDSSYVAVIRNAIEVVLDDRAEREDRERSGHSQETRRTEE